MEVEFTAKIPASVLYDYKLQHTYKQPLTIITTGLGLFLVYGYFSTSKLIYIILAAVIILYTPIELLLKSLTQAKMIPFYRDGIIYKINGEGIEIKAVAAEENENSPKDESPEIAESENVDEENKEDVTESSDEPEGEEPEEQRNFVAWNQIIKATNTKTSIFLYTSRNAAFIFPRACMGDKTEDILQLIFANVDKKALKIKY